MIVLLGDLANFAMLALTTSERNAAVTWPHSGGATPSALTTTTGNIIPTHGPWGTLWNYTEGIVHCYKIVQTRNGVSYCVYNPWVQLLMWPTWITRGISCMKEGKKGRGSKSVPLLVQLTGGINRDSTLTKLGHVSVNMAESRIMWERDLWICLWELSLLC